MVIPKMLSLLTDWETKGDSVNLDNQKTCCYSSNFSKFRGNQSYKIRLYKNRSILNTYRNNTFLSLEELERHIKFIVDFLPEGTVTSFSITEVKESPTTSEHFDLYITISGENIYHKFVLTWIRYAYELPYSLIILDANRLNNIEEFNHLNLLNKFLLCSSAWTEKPLYYWRSDMSMGHFCILHPDNVLLKKLKSESLGIEQLLSNVFGDPAEVFTKNLDPDQNCFGLLYPELGAEVEMIENPGPRLFQGSLNLLETDNWVRGDNFEKRLIVYKNNYKYLNSEYEQQTTT